MKEETRRKLLKASDPSLPAVGDDPVVRLIQAKQENDDDVVLSLSLRPTKLSEFTGQHDAIKNLKVCIEAAKERNEHLEPIS